jgi:tRNA-(ms[2]io[6]A)-hydroxylase
VLGLAAPTAPAWVDRVRARLDEVLVDHAHCEKKAASTAVSLLFRYPEEPVIQLPLAALAREELTHFEETIRHLTTRGVPFRHQVPSPYAARLLRVVRAHEPAGLIDRLLCSALIEARSCERMRLLADAVAEPALTALYRGLLASEARHHQLYVDLATRLAPAAGVRARLRELALHEAAVLGAVPPMPRLHG